MDLLRLDPGHLHVFVCIALAAQSANQTAQTANRMVCMAIQPCTWLSVSVIFKRKIRPEGQVQADFPDLLL